MKQITDIYYADYLALSADDNANAQNLLRVLGKSAVMIGWTA